MSWSRRSFFSSLSATALVLTLDDVLALAVPSRPQSTAQTGSRPTYDAVPRPAPKGPPSPIAGTPLGVSFIDVARQSGLNAKTIYGGEHKNRYLLETTGCGVAFYDYDHDDWIDIFLVNGTRLEGFPRDRNPYLISSKIIAMAPSPMSRSKPDLHAEDGGRAAVLATTTMTAGMIYSSVITDRTFSTATTKWHLY